jgi:hypothetical protein
MPKQIFSLEANGPKRLEISWKGFYKAVTIKMDGLPVGTVNDSKALAAGQDFTLSDGSLLNLRLASGLAGTELQVTRNGVPLPGSSSNPESRVKTAAGIIFFIAGLNLLLGILGVLTRSEMLANLGIGWYSLIFGGFFLWMGFLVRKFSKLALIFSIVIFGLDALIGVIGSAAMGGTPSIGGLVVKVLLIIPMIQAVRPIGEMKKAKSVPPVVPPLP